MDAAAMQFPRNASNFHAVSVRPGVVLRGWEGLLWRYAPLRGASELKIMSRNPLARHGWLR
jgi:hypothetical protein